ncbi:MAG: hypothetical protein L3J34_08765 [Flavobacteriaceae bacterium]|nr:hypothetical protein [Flavobacteriaceae bacterium]
MSNASNKPKASFWIISVIALIWNLMGVFAYLTQAYMSDEVLAALPDTERALYENLPAWVTVAYAIAVFGGTIGAILMLLKKKLSVQLFTISLLGVIIQMSYNFFMSNTIEVYGPSSIVMPIMIIVIAFYLVWYSKSVRTKGWLS